MKRLSHQQEKQLYKLCIDNDVSVQYGKLSLCDLRNFYYSNVYDNRRYQVHSDDNKYPWSKIYDNLDAAVEKFLEIKKKARRVK